MRASTGPASGCFAAIRTVQPAVASGPRKLTPRDPRAQVVVPVRYRYESIIDFVETQSVNVSKSGMFVMTGDMVPVGTVLDPQLATDSPDQAAALREAVDHRADAGGAEALVELAPAGYAAVRGELDEVIVAPPGIAMKRFDALDLHRRLRLRHRRCRRNGVQRRLRRANELDFPLHHGLHGIQRVEVERIVHRRPARGVGEPELVARVAAAVVPLGVFLGALHGAVGAIYPSGSAAGSNKFVVNPASGGVASGRS